MQGPKRNVTLNKLVREICKREGRKSQARIGDVREIIKVMAQLEDEYDNDEFGFSPISVLIDESWKKTQKRILKERRKNGN